MISARHDRIIFLAESWMHPSTEYLDLVVFLPTTQSDERRLFLYCDGEEPILWLDEIRITPIRFDTGTPRWVDFGVVSLPFLRKRNWSGGYFAQVKIEGLKPGNFKDHCLLITKDLDYSPEGRSLVTVEKDLWGLSRRDCGMSRLSPDQGIAGKHIDLKYSYTASEIGLPSGALLRLAFPSIFPQPQIDDPDGPGYLVIGGSAKIQISDIRKSDESHEMVDLFLKLEQEFLPGEVLEICYNNISLPIFPTDYISNDRKNWWQRMPPFSTAVALSEDHPFVCLLPDNSHKFKVVPGGMERLHLFLPGRSLDTEPITLRALYTDRFRNAPPQIGELDDFDLWIESKEARQILSNQRIDTDYYRFQIDLGTLHPGVYRVYAIDRTSGKEIARSNPLEVVSQDEPGEMLYWGEIHAHSEMSDGVGKFDDVYSRAKYEGCLDFAAGCDHAANFSDNQWLRMQDITNSWNNEGQFVTLIGYEWGGKQMHRNIYTSHSHLDAVRGRMMPDSQVTELWKAYQNDDQVVGGPHGSIGHGLIFEKHDPDIERFIEIYSMWGASDFLDSPLSLISNPVAANWNNPNSLSVNSVLQTGAKLGFTGGGDNHEARAGFSCEDPDGQGITPHSFSKDLAFRCGLTGVFASGLSRNQLVYALRQRRTYATTGARIILNFWIGDLIMGESGCLDVVDCHWEVHAVQSVKKIEVIRSGAMVYQLELNGLDIEGSWIDKNQLRGEQYYYLHVIQEDQEEAWSSPIWVEISS